MLDGADALRSLFTAFGAAPFISLMTRAPGRPPIPDDPESALQSPKRRALFERIQREPGVKARELKTEFGMAEGVFAGHLEKLERAGLVEVRLVLGYRQVYPAGQAPPIVLDAITSPKLLEVARIVLAHPDGISTSDVAQAAGIPERTARFHVRNLLEKRLVQQRGDGTRILYRPVEKLREMIHKTE